jgi:hypothetical protein
MNCENGIIGYFNGTKLYGNKFLVKKVRKKTHKWKWLDWIYLKLYGYTEIPDKDVYYFGDKIVGHPETLKTLVSEINKSR